MNPDFIESFVSIFDWEGDTPGLTEALTEWVNKCERNSPQGSKFTWRDAVGFRAGYKAALGLDAVPAEPPIGTVVEDRHGVPITRSENGLWGQRGMLPLASWGPMYLAHGPLHIVYYVCCDRCGYNMTASTCRVCG